MDTNSSQEKSERTVTQGFCLIRNPYHGGQHYKSGVPYSLFFHGEDFDRLASVGMPKWNNERAFAIAALIMNCTGNVIPTSRAEREDMLRAEGADKPTMADRFILRQVERAMVKAGLLIGRPDGVYYSSRPLPSVDPDVPVDLLMPDKVYVPREKDWDYATADFHGVYELSARDRRAVLALETELDPTKSYLEDNYEEEDQIDVDEALDVLNALAGLIPGFDELDSKSGPVDTERAFDDVEDQDGDDYDPIDHIFAGIGNDEDEEPKAS